MDYEFRKPEPLKPFRGIFVMRIGDQGCGVGYYK